MGVANVEELLSEESTIPTTCSVINAFPRSKVYARWAADASGDAMKEFNVKELDAIARQAARWTGAR